MKIESLEIENFKPYSNIQIPHEGKLPDGLFLIKGANSTGKTSLVEAILWALWGPRAIPTEINQEQLVKHEANSCKVDLVFNVGGTQYQVTRRYRVSYGSDVVLLRGDDGVFHPIEKGVTDVEAKLEDILGVAHEAALDTVFIRQGEVDRLSVAKPSELRDLIRDLFRLDTFDDIADKLKEKTDKLDNEIRSLEKEVATKPEKEKNKKRLEKEIKELNIKISNLEKREKLLQAEVEEIPEEQVLKKIDKIQNDIESLSRRIKDAEENIRKLNERKEERETRLEELPELEVIKKIEKKNQGIKDLESKIEKIGEKLKSIKKQKGLLEERKSADKKDYISCREDLEKKKGELGELPDLEALREIDNTIQSIDESKRRLDSLEERRKSVHRQMDLLGKENEKDLEHLKELEKSLSESKESLKELPTISDIKEIRKRHDSAKQADSHLDRLKKKARKKAEKLDLDPSIIEKPERMSSFLDEIKKDLDEAVEKEKNIDEDLSKAREKRGYLKKTINEIESNEANLEELEECPTCLRDISDEELPNIKKHMEEHKDELAKDLKSVVKKITKLQDKQDRLEEKIQGFRERLGKLEQYQQELEKITKSEQEASSELQRLGQFLNSIGYDDLETLIAETGENDLDGILGKVTSLNSRTADLKKDIKRLDDEVSERREDLSNLESETQEIHRLEKEKKNDLEEFEQKLGDAIEKTRYNSVSDMLEKLCAEEINDLIQKATLLESQIETLETRIEDLEKKLENEKNRIEDLEEETQKQLELQRKKRDKFESAREGLEKVLDKTGFDSIKELLETYGVEGLNELILDIKELQTKIGETKNSIKETKDIKTEKMKERTEQEASLRDIFSGISYDNIGDMYRSLEKKSITDIISYRTEKETKLAECLDNLEEKQSQEQDRKKRVDQLQEEIEELEEKEEEIKEKKRIEAHAERLRVNLDDFVSEYVIQERLCGALKKSVTEYLQHFSRGRYSVADMNTHTFGSYGAGVTITLKDLIQDQEKPRELLSGGDKVSLGLAMRIAIAFLASRIRPFKTETIQQSNIRCLIMDEPLGSLDSERRPEVVRTLLDTRSFSQIFLITHTDTGLTDEELVEANRINVSQQEGESRISLTLKGAS